MKRIALLVIGMILLLSCEDETAATLSGEWKLVHYYNRETNELESESFRTEPLIVKLADNGLNGALVCHTSCDSIAINYALSPKNKIIISSPDSTIAAKTPWESKLLKGLTHASSFKLNIHSMNLYFNNDQEVLIFIRK